MRVVIGSSVGGVVGAAAGEGGEMTFCHKDAVMRADVVAMGDG